MDWEIAEKEREQKLQDAMGQADIEREKFRKGIPGQRGTGC